MDPRIVILTQAIKTNKKQMVDPIQLKKGDVIDWSEDNLGRKNCVLLITSKLNLNKGVLSFSYLSDMGNKGVAIMPKIKEMIYKYLVE